MFAPRYIQRDAQGIQPAHHPVEVKKSPEFEEFGTIHANAELSNGSVSELGFQKEKQTSQRKSATSIYVQYKVQKKIDETTPIHI